MVLNQDEIFLWPEMQTYTSEEFKKKAHLWKEELRLFEQELSDDPELIIPNGTGIEHFTMVVLRLCGYNHETALQCWKRAAQQRKQKIEPSQHYHLRKMITILRELDSEVFWPDLWDTPANEWEDKLSYIKKEFSNLKESLAEEKGLVLSLDEDEFLLRFFRVRKYDHKRTVQLIRNYFRSRAENPELYQGYLPSAMLHHFALDLIAMNTFNDDQGRFVCFVKLGKWNPAIMKLEDTYRYAMIHFETVSFFPLVQIYGVVLVVDMREFRLAILRYLTPLFLKRLFGAIQKCIPIKLKAIHVVFENATFDIAFAVVKPFLGRKLRSRIHLHGSDMKSLHQHVKPELLYSDYGGTRESFNCSGIPESLLHFEPIFKRIRNFGYKKEGQ